MLVIGNVFPKLETVKILLRLLSENRRFSRRFDSQHVKASQIYEKFPGEHLCHVFSSFSRKLIWKMSPLVLGAVLVVFVNRLTSDGKYPVHDSENLQLPIQMQLSEKGKTFCEFFLAFLESTSNFKHFENDEDSHR